MLGEMLEDFAYDFEVHGIAIESMKKTLLIIEDDADIQDYLSFLLADLDMEIERSVNGREALAIIDSGRRIDLILLDVIMPVMGGEEFFRQLRQERGSTIPVIISSVDEKISGRLLSMGVVQGLYRKGGPGTS